MATRPRFDHARVRRAMLDLAREQGVAALGLQASYHWHADPKRLAVTLARYKFVGKLLAGRKHVLEVGCGDGFGARLVLQEALRLTAVDLDPELIEDARRRARLDPRWSFECRLHDVLDSPVPGRFDAAYALDVLAHIPRRLEDRFLGNICRSLTQQSILVLATPSEVSRRFSKRDTNAAHRNMKSPDELKTLVLRHFHNCLLFSANDETVHTGFYPLAHTLFAVGVTKRRRLPC